VAAAGGASGSVTANSATATGTGATGSAATGASGKESLISKMCDTNS
jgi:hypothetical protein